MFDFSSLFLDSGAKLRIILILNHFTHYEFKLFLKFLDVNQLTNKKTRQIAALSMTYVAFLFYR